MACGTVCPITVIVTNKNMVILLIIFFIFSAIWFVNILLVQNYEKKQYQNEF
jgi:hypothetical protein